MLAAPGRRLLVALLVVLATAALLVALFPAVRADFGLGDDENEKPGVSKTKRRPAPASAPAPTPAPAPARDRPRDKAR